MARRRLEGPPIGIDLGTTYSCVGVWLRDHVEIVANGQGRPTTPSCVAFTKTECLVGDAAENQCNTNPANTVFGVKRLIGRQFGNPYVQNQISHCPFKVIAGSGDKPIIVVNYKAEEKQCTAEEISSMILDHMRKIAETFVGGKVKNAVVTVPAYFNNAQRRATRQAGKMAGLNIMRIINEPMAAAIAYGLHNMTGVEDKNVLIFDLGGGTFDVSIVNIKGGHFKVKATAGDTYLGGEDFTNRMVSYFVEEFESTYERGVSDNCKALGRLRTECEKAKRTLSFAKETSIDLDFFHDRIDLQTSITRSKFEELNKDLFDRCIDIVTKCLWDVNMKKRDIHDVVLVGGSTRIPKLEELLKETFLGVTLRKSISRDEAVAFGATMLAANLAGEGSEKVQGLVLHDVTPLSLGTDKIGGVMSVLIPRNTPVPARKQCAFKTVRDNQSCIGVGIYEGERELVDDNNFLGEFDLDNIPPAPAGVQKISVTFDIDVDGVLVVSAQLGANGLTKEITITEEKSKQASNEIERVVSGALIHNDDDAKRRENAESRGQLEHLLHNLRVRMGTNEIASRMKGDRAEMEDEIEKVTEWLRENQLASAREYDERRNKLNKMWDDLFKGKQRSSCSCFG